MINQFDNDEVQKSKRLKIDEKIRFIKEWREKYPEVTFSKIHIPEKELRKLASSEEEYKYLRREYGKIQKYYGYICEIMSVDILSEEQICIMKELELSAKNFEYSNMIVELSKQYGLEKKMTKYIIHEYGSIENFIRLYRNGELNSSDRRYARKHIKSYIDIDESNYESNYSRLLEDIYGKKNQITFYSSKAIGRIIYFMPEDYGIYLQERYGLNDGEFKTYEKVGEMKNITKQGVQTKIVNIIKKIRSSKLYLEEIFPTKNVECSIVVSSIKKTIDELKEEIDNNGFAFKTVIKHDDGLTKKFEKIRIFLGIDNKEDIPFEEDYEMKTSEFKEDAERKVNESEQDAQRATNESEQEERSEIEEEKESFVSLYRKGKLEGNDLEIAKLTIGSYIDLDENPYEENYERLVEDIYGKTNEIKFYSTEGIEDVIQSLTLSEQRIIRYRYGLQNFDLLSIEQKIYMKDICGIEKIEPMDYNEIAKLENITIDETQNIIANTIECMRDKNSNTEKIFLFGKNEMYFCLTEERELIDKFKKRFDESSYLYKLENNLEIKALRDKRDKLQEEVQRNNGKIQEAQNLLEQCEDVLCENTEKNLND